MMHLHASVRLSLAATHPAPPLQFGPGDWVELRPLGAFSLAEIPGDLPPAEATAWHLRERVVAGEIVTTEATFTLPRDLDEVPLLVRWHLVTVLEQLWWGTEYQEPPVAADTLKNAAAPSPAP